VTQQRNQQRRIAVVGGGISGLAAANRLVELGLGDGLLLFESGERLGGALWTVHEEGLQVEQGVDNFITTLPWGLDLCRRLGLADRLVQTNPDFRQTYVVRRGRLHKLPDGFLMMAPTRMWPLAVTPLLSPLGKLRCALEYFIPPSRSEADESMAAFVRRRLGREAFERLVEPLVSAVYAADLEKLSVEATLSRFREMEREHGSLVRAMRRQMTARRKDRKAGQKAESGPRFSMFVTLRDGLSSLVDAIVERLPAGAVRTGTSVDAVARVGDRWRLTLGGGRAEEVDDLILATPSHAAARLLEPVDAELAGLLGRIEHSGTAVVSVAYRREQIDHPLTGLGIVVPAAERSPILACSLSSQKYTHRAPEGTMLLRVFAGGTRRPELAETPDAQLLPEILDNLSRLLRITGEPIYTRVARWPNNMPQYHVGHKQLVERIEALAGRLPNFSLAGNSYHGVGIPDCINGAQQAAERLARN